MNGTVLVPIIEPRLTVSVHAVWRPPMTSLVAALLDIVDAMPAPPAATSRARGATTAA
jgi:hypothetical protein